MDDRSRESRAIILLLILIAIGGIVMYGKGKIPYNVKAPVYATPR